MSWWYLNTVWIKSIISCLVNPCGFFPTQTSFLSDLDLRPSYSSYSLRMVHVGGFLLCGVSFSFFYFSFFLILPFKMFKMFKCVYNLYTHSFLEMGT